MRAIKRYIFYFYDFKDVSCQMKGDGTCVPNSTFKIDCNDCFCTPSGLAACTLKGCLETLPERPKRQVLPQGIFNQSMINENYLSIDKIKKF